MYVARGATCDVGARGSQRFSRPLAMRIGALTLVIGGRTLVGTASDVADQQHLPQGGHMGATKILGIVLLVAGLLGLFYGHFEYTKETHEGQFGPFRFSVAEKETAVIPSWASLGVIVAGVVLLVINRK
jgi:hypothetical protein